MSQLTELSVILERIANGEHSEADLHILRDLLNRDGHLPSLLQGGKYRVNIRQASGQVHIGDRLELTEKDIQAIAQAIQAEVSNSTLSQPTEIASVDELVQQVRSRIYEDIQRLHGTMPLWGVDHWIPLGELFVDVNILEKVSSNRRLELADLWQDFSQNPSYRGLDRMGLGTKRQRVSGLEVLNRNINLMVVGKPGSGKTTYLQRVVTECNAGNLQAQRIPVLIRLREFVEDGREVGYSVERYLERCWRLSATEVQRVLNAGRSLVLMDGLDEVIGADAQAVNKQIKRFSRTYPQAQVIVTCRTQSQESRFERFNYVEVADFDELQVRDFAEHWFQTVCGNATVGQTKATAFLEQLFREENKSIRELAITPILLSLTCSVFQQTGKFYSKRSKLYDEGLDLLMEQWDKSREIERDEIYRDLSAKRKPELLSHLATEKFEQPRYVLFEQTEIEEYISEFLKLGLQDSRTVLKAIETQHGLLIERVRHVWSFSHLTFQEYLTANHIVSCNEIPRLVDQIKNSHWRVVFLLVSEMTENTNVLIEQIQRKIAEFLSNDKIIDQILDSINRHVISIDTNYKDVAVKAFYLSRDMNLFDSLAFKLDQELSEDYRFALRFAEDINYTLCPDTDEVKSFKDLSIDNRLYESTKRAIARYIIFDQNISNGLQRLKRNESIFESSVEWDDACEEWIEDICDAMSDCDQPLNDWDDYLNSDNEADYHLHNYYLANKVLIDCMNSSSKITEKEREEIESRLLLPSGKSI